MDINTGKLVKILLGETRGFVIDLNVLKTGDTVYEVKEECILEWEVRKRTNSKIHVINKDKEDIINTSKILRTEQVHNFFVDQEIGLALSKAKIEREEDSLQSIISMNQTESQMNEAIEDAKERIRRFNKDLRRFF